MSKSVLLLLFVWLLGSLIACTTPSRPDPQPAKVPGPTWSPTRPVTVGETSTASPAPDVKATPAALLPLVVGGSVSATPTLAPTSTRQPYPMPATPQPYPLRTAAAPDPPTAASTPSPRITPTRAHPVYSGPPLSRSEIGVQVHLHNEDIEGILRHLRALGAGWVKVQVSWKLYEPEPDRYDENLLRELDRLVSGARASDIYLLVSVAKAPDWSRPVTELDGPPDDFAQFEDFLHFLATRYEGNVAAYELWNEPNLRREWNGAPLSAASFASLVRSGASGVRSADPLAIVISGAPAPTGINDGIDAIDDRLYVQAMLAAGVTDSVDAIGAHPYGWSNPPDASMAAPDPVSPTHNNHASFFFRDTLWDYYSLLSQAGHAQKQVWVTEFGWASFDGLESAPPAGLEYMNAVSEWQQASYTLRAFELAHEWLWVGPLFLWNLNFGPLLGTDFPESGYSLLRPDGSPRPVFFAVQSMGKE